MRVRVCVCVGGVRNWHLRQYVCIIDVSCASVEDEGEPLCLFCMWLEQSSGLIAHTEKMKGLLWIKVLGRLRT